MSEIQWWANTNLGRTHFPCTIYSAYEYLIYYESGDSHVHEMVVWMSSITLTFEPRTITIFQARDLMFL